MMYLQQHPRQKKLHPLLQRPRTLHIWNRISYTNHILPEEILNLDSLLMTANRGKRRVQHGRLGALKLVLECTERSSRREHHSDR